MQSQVLAIGDAVLVIGTADDGKVGTILRLIDNQYLVALEDGSEVLLSADHLSLRY